jgi:hypothetical protein
MEWGGIWPGWDTALALYVLGRITHPLFPSMVKVLSWMRTDPGNESSLAFERLLDDWGCSRFGPHLGADAIAGCELYAILQQGTSEWLRMVGGIKSGPYVFTANHPFEPHEQVCDVQDFS